MIKYLSKLKIKAMTQTAWISLLITVIIIVIGLLLGGKVLFTQIS